MTKREEELAALRSGERPCVRSGQYWSKEEREKLLRDFESGAGISELALELNRTEPAVVQELKNEGAFENQSRHRGRNQPKPSGCPSCCQCPVCTVWNCPNRGKEFWDAGTVR